MRVVAEVDNRYPSGMAKRQLMGSEEVRSGWRKQMDGITEPEAPHTVVIRRGKPVAVLVPIDWYRQAAAAMDDPTDL